MISRVLSRRIAVGLREPYPDAPTIDEGAALELLVATSLDCRHFHNEAMVQQVCVNCGVCMAAYLCVTCKLFDDDVGSFAMIAEKLQTSSTMLLLRNARIANPTTLAKQGAEQGGRYDKTGNVSMVTNTLALV
ncbi:hypothetical protein Dsin_017605 [Dipteronia sinensis]|uniref:Uncharacterized protein n=1 Tax=Dipteronia sinensis TaxID=43782 RepID=A0AAE0E6Q2_9ROSI|nr:hypothetical protein Dsin_017605 [Dipteronia sinensis]